MKTLRNRSEKEEELKKDGREEQNERRRGEKSRAERKERGEEKALARGINGANCHCYHWWQLI